MPGEPLPHCEFEGKDLLLRYEVTLPADVKTISPIVDSVMGMVEELGCAAGKEFEVETALREALANAIIHGAGKDPSKEVQFLVACDQARGMLIVVRDPGQGFDPDSLPSPVVGQEIYATHGRGIYLINQLMDEVRYARGGTEIIMKKR
jgi:serine/threonine-protein kinase RsbW